MRWFLVLALVACKAPPGEQAAKALPDEPVARSAAIAEGVAKVRRLALKAPIPAKQQTAAELSAALDRMVAAGTPANANDTTALVALGLLTPGVDIGQSQKTALVTQLAAYYDPAVKTFFIVSLPENPLMKDGMLAHELAHGLQDQHFDLQRYLSGPPEAPLDSDEVLARKFVVEGDATLVIFAYTQFALTGQWELMNDVTKQARVYLEKVANAPLSTMVATMQAQTAEAAKTEPSIAAANAAMGSLPPIVLVPLVSPYMKGGLYVLDAWEKKHRSWDGVNELFAKPPRSTEEVLHPGREHEPLFRITLPAFDGFEVLSTDVLGELRWTIYFSLWNTPDPGTNWSGDRYAVIRRAGEPPVALIASAWDSPPIAESFATAYRATLARRYGKDAGAPTHQVTVVGDRVFIVDGSADPALMQALVERTVFALR